jgi:ficolin
VASCSNLYKSGERRDGLYTINPDDLGSFQVRCDMQTDCGGWTVFQRRQDASVNFYRGWQDYKNGFGDLNGNFWLGLDRIHRLTKSGQNVSLRVDLMDWTNDTVYAKYGSFSVASESGNYKLNLSSFSGKYMI